MDSKTKFHIYAINQSINRVNVFCSLLVMPKEKWPFIANGPMKLEKEFVLSHSVLYCVDVFTEIVSREILRECVYSSSLVQTKINVPQSKSQHSQKKYIDPIEVARILSMAIRPEDYCVPFDE